MISAVAARKAAQAAQQQQGQETSRPLPSVQASQSPKRKSSSQRSEPPSKKQKRNVRQLTKPSVKSTPLPEVSRTQNDVIIIDSDNDEPESNARILSEESDVEILSAPQHRLEGRAWSPSTPMYDSSDEDAAIDTSGLIDMPSRVPPLQESSSGVILSTFSPLPGQDIFFLSTDDVRGLGPGFQEETKGTLVTLEEGDRMYLLGTCRLMVLRGSIAVNGAVLHPSSTRHNIFAPRSSPLPIIEYHGGDTKAVIDATCLPHPLESLFATKSTLVLLQELRTNVEGLGLVCRTFEGGYEPSGRIDGSVSAPFQIDGLYLVTKSTRAFAPFTMPRSWDASLSSLSTSTPMPSNPIYLVKGPKKCGKSTFTRTLLNALLARYKRVAFLDCDPGQSEFMPGGFVSLHVIAEPVFGPPYTHPTLPFRAHFIAATSPKSSPNTYLDGVKDLIDAWRVDVMHAPVSSALDEDERVVDTIPLVVNTMGWSKGLGADLMQKIEQTVEPGQVFAFQTEDGSRHSDPSELLSPHHNTGAVKTHFLEPAPLSALSTNYTPADHRNLSIMSYFHAAFPVPRKLSNREPYLDPIIAQTWNTALPLCAIPPYEIDVHAAFDQIVLTGAGSEDVIPNELSRVLNGALVGFVRLDHQSSFMTDTASQVDISSVPYVQCQPPPAPSESSCIGLGLIRGVSFPLTSGDIDATARATLHILTPIPPALLTNARVLVKGEMELPIWGMLDFREFTNTGDTGGIAGVEKGRVPYLQWGRVSEGAIGAEKRRVRRNLMRRGQV